MIYIAHRGNVFGRMESRENEPSYIDEAISGGYDVEIDVWVRGNLMFLGHDEPKYEIDFRWIRDRISKLWVHCKNVEAMTYFNGCSYDVNYFWHEKDKLTLTSKNYMWVFPGNQPIKNSIAVIPEKYDDNIDHCIGICTDNIIKYKTNGEN